MSLSFHKIKMEPLPPYLPHVLFVHGLRAAESNARAQLQVRGPFATKKFPNSQEKSASSKLGNCLVKQTKIRPDISPKTSPTNPDLKRHNNLPPPLTKNVSELTYHVSNTFFQAMSSQKLQITEKSGQKVENAFRRLKLTQNHPKPTKYYKDEFTENPAECK